MCKFIGDNNSQKVIVKTKPCMNDIYVKYEANTGREPALCCPYENRFNQSMLLLIIYICINFPATQERCLQNQQTTKQNVRLVEMSMFA